MISEQKLSKNVLTSRLSLLIFSLGFCPPALATEQLPPNMTLDTEVRLQGADINNGDLDTHGSTSAGVLAAEAKFKFTDNSSQNTLFFWEGRGVAAAGHTGLQDENTGAISNSGSFLEWRQSYFQFSDLGGYPPASVRIGRQMVAEPYGLWWNQDFDALRASYESSIFRGTFIGGQNLFTYSTNNNASFIEDQKDITRVLAEGSWQYHYQQFFQTRLAYADDRQDLNLGKAATNIDPYNNRGEMYWGGVRAAGKTAVYPGAGEQKLQYRVDLLGVTGHEDTGTLGAAHTVTAINSRNVAGWAFDAGTDIPLPHLKPLIHLGYAYGSGGNGATGTDHAFHQTGLQGNYSQIGALSQNTDNYGTVLRPELSNIHIVSAGITAPVLHASDVGVIYRYYRLADTATSLVSSGVFNTLDGTHKDLGQGVDLLFNTDVMKEAAWNPSHVQSVGFKSSLGFFRSGDAYGTAKGQNAVRGLVELKVGF